MEPLFSGASGDDAFLQQLAADQVAPLEALGRIAAHHHGQPAGLMPFREIHVAAGAQHFPAPDDLSTLVGLLMVNTRQLFDAAKDPIDDLHVAGFLLWGLTAIHPFDDANGRAAGDFVQYTLMGRWRSTTPPFANLRDLGLLEPVFRQLDPGNDGSPEGHLRQLQQLLGAFAQITLEDLKSNKHFVTIAKVLGASLTSKS